MSKANWLYHPRTGIVVITLSILVSFFWNISQHVNVYRYAFVGALFEFGALPMAILFLTLVVIAMMLLVSSRVPNRLLALLSLLLLLITFFFVVIYPL